MSFNSFSFLLFLGIVYLAFYFTNCRWRWVVLLTASYCFYATLNVPYLLAVLSLSTVISYIFGLRISVQSDESKRKWWLWGGIASCLAILFILKYLNFIETQIDSILGLNHTFSALLVSIGVSYYSFQAISYLIDIYMEIQEPEPHFGFYALYLAFFPKLLQGPIERAGDLLPQLKQTYEFDYDTMRSGLLLFICGLFKKVIVADRLALYADQVYNNVQDYSGLALIIGTYAYALQIYFDFSAYTDMVRGSGRMFGIKLTENFNAPYLSTSIADFWRRWHISFSRWILDYIFKPLQISWRDWGNKGTALALITTFLVCGIWHGATWGFIIWGLLHGVYLANSLYYRPYKKRLHKWLGIEKARFLPWWQLFITFNMVSFAWIFFRANSITDASYVVSNIFNASKHNNDISFLLLTSSSDGYVLLVSLVLVVIGSVLFKNKSLFELPFAVRWLAYSSITIFIIRYGLFDNSRFIYNKF